MTPEVAMPMLGAAARNLFNVINACTTDLQLDEAAMLLWGSAWPKRVDDNEASFLSECIEGRRSHRRPTARAVGTIAGRISIFPARQYQTSPDREASRNRRRILGGSSALPDGLRHHYTEGQRSVLCVIANEVKRQGICDLAIDAIGAMAGVCRTTVQNAIRLARCLGHLRITARPRKRQKNLTNIIEIAAADWLAWVKRAPSSARRIGFTLSKISCRTENTDSRKEDAFRGFGAVSGSRATR